MKTSLRKLRGLALPKHEAKDHRIALQPLAQLDELAQASQDMQDMRDCYDSLLSAAAATANSAYEFSESLREMGACLLQKTALNDDEDGGKVLLMLGKLQYELHKLVDSYRSHIFQTIAVPSESLLNELQTVEEMKIQCDEKRDVYEYMLKRQKEKGRLRGGKGETFSVQQIQLARDEYDEEATLFVFRLKSLKQGQSRSLLTQAARHHAAQLCFFKKALSSVEAAEPHVKLVTEQQHIDYKFNGLDDEGDGDNDDDDNDDDDSSFVNDDGELSFDYGNNEREPDVSTTRSSMELDQVDITFPKISSVEALKDRLRRNSFSFKGRAFSQSAPLFPENKLDQTEKMRHLQPSLSRKFHSYVLPTPVDTNHSVSTGPGNTVPETVQTRLSGRQNLWHSSPLEPNNEKIMGDKKPAGPTVINAQSVLRESNNNIASHRLPPPLAGRMLSTGLDPLAAFDSKKLKRLAFSGPLTSKHSSSKPVSVGSHQMFSGPLLRNPIPQPPSVSPPKVSPNASPTFMSSPKISELHELPRPPVGLTSKSARPLVGHSAPLAPRAQMQSTSSKPPLSPTASPLPTPPQIIPRSFSIPSRSPRVTELHVSKSHEVFPVPEKSEDVASPPLSPIALSNSPKKS
ncbi:PREDICTED: uncharacterized protein At2g33490 [Fragaria vesca subsp. vesca]|uniref:uncharacterized protein At2g33490 n=1 Tax=Fragaria vesca subsp. vesca TaxID=101020 RepID=UPI0002C36483|nr:PREDICTED: uncharacterized protein At2g33490 [Fragaria vesca subsp. vesca]